MVATTSRSTLLEDVVRWREEGSSLRERLVREKTALLERVAEIDEALAAIPAAVEPKTATASRPVVAEPTRTNIPQAIVELVTNLPGLSSGDICEHILRDNPGMARPQIHTYIYRLLKRGRLKAREERGERVLYPVAQAGAIGEPLPALKSVGKGGTSPLNSSEQAESIARPGVSAVGSSRRQGTP